MSHGEQNSGIDVPLVRMIGMLGLGSLHYVCRNEVNF